MSFDIPIADPPSKDQLVAIAKRQRIRELRYKIKVKVGDNDSLIGTTADGVMVTIDNLAMDMLAVNKSANSSYRDNRITLYEELHGKGSWDVGVNNSQLWFDGRKSGAIKSTVDVKGGDAVFKDLSHRITTVANILEDQS